MLRLRSCASSMIIVSYARSSGSLCVSASRMPSVISLTRARSADVVLEAHLVADDLAERRVQLLRDALGDARAAIRRGCVWPISAAAAPRPMLEAGSSAAAWSCPSRSRRRR